MTFLQVALAAFLCIAITLNWFRVKNANLLARKMFRSVVLLALLIISALGAFHSVIQATEIASLLPWIAPFVLLTALSHGLDPVHKASTTSVRLFVTLAPALLVVFALLIGNAVSRTSLDDGPLPLSELMGVVLLLAGGVAFKDFNNIKGMTPDSDRWVRVDGLPDEAPPLREQTSDDEIWARIMLLCLLIVSCFLLLAVPVATTSTLETSIVWPFIPAIAAIALAWQALRGRPQRLVLHIPSRVYVLSTVASGFSVISIVWSSTLMSDYSNMYPVAMAHRLVVGILVGSLWAEDFLVSLFALNRIPAHRREWVYALTCSIAWTTIVVAASSVRYYEKGEFRLTWVATNGLLLLLAYVSSVLSWRAIGQHIPKSRLLTLKAPRDIALSDNAMFVALAGGCVAGVSLVTNGENPTVAGALVGIVLSFLLFAFRNDQAHLKNEMVRFEEDGASLGRRPEEYKASLRVLRYHLRFQEAIPLIAVLASFLWAAVEWLV